MKHVNGKSRIVALGKFFFGFFILTLIVSLLFRNLELPPFMMSVLDVAVMCFYAIALVSLAIVIFSGPVKAIRRRLQPSDMLLPPIEWRRHVPIKSVACCLFSGLLAMSFSDIMSSSARNQVIRFLDQTSENVRVQINGNDVTNPIEVVHALSKIRRVGQHHSHARDEFQVEVTSRGGRLALKIGRDSEKANEYWVFYPHYSHTSKMHIGSVVTSIFDDY